LVALVSDASAAVSAVLVADAVASSAYGFNDQSAYGFIDQSSRDFITSAYCHECTINRDRTDYSYWSSMEFSATSPQRP
jgi:hypothetical protein